MNAHDPATNAPATTPAPHAPAYVFHRGALGDSILLWPLLRSLVATHGRVAFVTDGSKAKLAARFVRGVDPIDAEQPRFNAMFAPSPSPTRDFRPVNASRVLCFLFGEVNEPSRPWEHNARTMFPDASIDMVYERPDAILARRMAPEHQHASPRSNRQGRLVIHIGAGSPSKRLPYQIWADLYGDEWRNPPRFIGGEAEFARISEADWSTVNDTLHSHYLTTLDSLADELISARAFVGFDTGPTHLAAQLGLPTLALFGPTDPARWKPTGPLVRVLAPARTTPDMSWLSPEVVARAIAAL